MKVTNKTKKKGKHAHRLRSFGFVTTTADGASALLKIVDADLEGRQLRFEPANARDSRTGAPSDSAPSSTLIAKGLSWNSTDESLAAHFEGCVSARIITDRETGRSKG